MIKALRGGREGRTHGPSEWRRFCNYLKAIHGEIERKSTKGNKYNQIERSWIKIVVSLESCCSAGKGNAPPR